MLDYYRFPHSTRTVRPDKREACDILYRRRKNIFMYLYYYNITASLEDELEPVLLSLGLFSAKPYIHKQNRNEISVHFLVKVSHQENMCCLDFTCIRLFYVFWPAFEHY